MTGNEYQELAARTINKHLTDRGLEKHSLHGMVGEIGEIHSLYQKYYQGHMIDSNELMAELGDLLWFAAEFATSKGWKLDDVMEANIEKLRKRYPDGFSSERSLNR